MFTTDVMGIGRMTLTDISIIAILGGLGAWYYFFIVRDKLTGITGP